MKKLAYILIGVVLTIGLFSILGSVIMEPNNNPTRTPAPIPQTATPELVIPTATLQPVFPTATINPGSTITAVPQDDKKKKNSTPTPTLILLVENGECAQENDCMCLIVTQLAVANDLQRTQIANDARVCVQP